MLEINPSSVSQGLFWSDKASESVNLSLFTWNIRQVNEPACMSTTLN